MCWLKIYYNCWPNAAIHLLPSFLLCYQSEKKTFFLFLNWEIYIVHHVVHANHFLELTVLTLLINVVGRYIIYDHIHSSLVRSIIGKLCHVYVLIYSLYHGLDSYQVVIPLEIIVICDWLDRRSLSSNNFIAMCSILKSSYDLWILKLSWVNTIS